MRRGGASVLSFGKTYSKIFSEHFLISRILILIAALLC
jgi:hypothetical protein